MVIQESRDEGGLSLSKSADGFTRLNRPGFFGRKRDGIVAELNEKWGPKGWRLSWIVGAESCGFANACSRYYEQSYFEFLRLQPWLVDDICGYGEVIDNALTNIESECNYEMQEAFSTHIQDIAIRNALRRLGRWFTGSRNDILVVRSKDSNGYQFSPGLVPFYAPSLITHPSKCPKWAGAGSVEDFWQSNKLVEVVME